MVKEITKQTLRFIENGVIDWTPIKDYFNDLEDVINDHADEIKASVQRQTVLYRYPIWASGTFTMLRGGKHPRLKIIDGWITVADNSDRAQKIEVIDIAEPVDISSSYSAGVIIPLPIRLNSDKIMFHKDVEIRALGERRVVIEMLCETYELEE